MEKIYLLVRPKKGSSIEERINREIFASECFDGIKKELGEEFEKLIKRVIVPLEGDIMKENAGLSKENI